MNLPPPSDPAPPAPATTAPAGGPSRSPRWQWAAVAVATLLVIGAVVFAATQLGGSDDDDDDATLSTAPIGTADPSSEAASASAGSGPAAGSSASTAPSATIAAEDIVAVGDVVEVAGGSTLRVDSVVPDAPTPDGVFAPPAGVTVTRVDVEGCAGADGLQVSPDVFLGFLDDISVATRFGAGTDLIDLDLAPGGCFRATLGFEVPAGRFLKTLVAYEGNDELGRWELNLGEAPADALAGSAAPASAALGTSVTLADGSSATARSLRPAPLAPSVPGTGLGAVVADVQRCAGTAPLTVSPFNWLVVATDHRVGTNIFSPATFPAADVAPGQCAEGTVTLTLPTGSTPEYVLLVDADGAELARWAMP